MGYKQFKQISAPSVSLASAPGPRRIAAAPSEFQPDRSLVRSIGKAYSMNSVFQQEKIAPHGCGAWRRGFPRQPPCPLRKARMRKLASSAP